MTVTVAEPDWPSLVAVMTTEPADAAVTRPAPVTSAIFGWSLDQEMTRPRSVFPAASLSSAESWIV